MYFYEHFYCNPLWNRLGEAFSYLSLYKRDANCGRKDTPQSYHHLFLGMTSNNSDFLECSNNCSAKAVLSCKKCEINYCLKCSHIAHEQPALKNKLESAQSSVEKAFEDAEKVVSSNKNLNKDKITVVFTCIRAAVDTCERELNECIDNIDDNNKEKLEKYQQNVTDATLKLEQYRKELENILVNNNYEMLLQSRENLTENIDQIEKDLEKLESSVEIRFTIENIDNLQTAVNDALKTVKIVQKQGSFSSHSPHADPQLVKLFKSVNDQGTTITDPEIITYIREHMDPSEKFYIRNIVLSYLEACLINRDPQKKIQEDIAKKRMTVLNAIIEHKPEAEIQAVYAIQNFVNKLEHPPKMAQLLFDIFYDEECVSEDAFFEWLRNPDQSETEGHAIVEISTKDFFTWLEQAETELEEGEEEEGS
ncbi:unnamed protein product [Rotaria magnacalcarata]|uniref:W2 domain-containing protein n=3 Tax=Rotaria magnacalcarata TaxID=392030 RepID=A0A816A6F4_9BILA|nr:unnamed protein product [Rotaria magnacalcarata]